MSNTSCSDIGVGGGLVVGLLLVVVVLLSMAFPSAVTKAGWDFDIFDAVVNVDLKTVSWVVTVSGVSGETGGKWYFGALILLI